MLRADKAKLIDELNQVFGGTEVVVVAHYQGLSVPEITALRGAVRDAGGKFQVTKNRLTKLALAGTPYEGIADMFKGPTAIAFAQEPVGVPKALVDFSRKNDKLKIVGGGLGTTMLDADAVKALAELPSLDELRGKIVGLINAPLQRIVGVLQAPGGQVARVLAAYAESGK